MYRYLVACLCLLCCSCVAPAESLDRSAAPVRLQGRQLYIVPFETIMVPEEVSAGLIDNFVDRLNHWGETQELEFVILKQGLEQIDSGWLAARTYLRGEVFAYVEDVGTEMTDIKARGRVRLFQPGSAGPVLEITYPTEIFYQNDYSSLSVERRRMAEKIAINLADSFLAAIARR